MISIYTTKDNLKSICTDNSKEPWFNMIIKLKEVFVNDDDIFLEGVDPDDDPFYILDGMQVDINSSRKDYINNIPQNPVIVLQYPSGIFLLDIPVDKANQIQKDYGVLCQSTKQLDHTPLTQVHFPTELLDGEKDKSWSSMIAQYKELPSNSALIIDAHLFAEDKFDEGKRNGIDNLFNILNYILPSSFKDTYHIGVLITDTDKAKAAKRSRSNLTNDRIATAINRLKKELNRSYPINIEVVFFDHNDNDGHKLIHDRRIISNYFIVTASYKLAALREGISRCRQTIAAFPLFEGIEKFPDYDKKEKLIRNDIKLFSDFIDRQPNSHTALLYQNGQKKEDFSLLKHRFFKKD